MKLGLELGGKDPCYVTDQVDIESVAESVASGCFYNAGQSCCAIERLYVHEAVYESFLEALVKAAGAYQLGDPADPETTLGPLTLPHQKPWVEAHIQDAIDQGATVVWQGLPINASGMHGEHFQPATILAGVTDAMRIQHEETFGPVIGVQMVSDDAQALQAMNRTDYGLTASVYCRDHARAEAILQRLEVGTAYVNCCDRVSPWLPWSGRRHSGLGMTLGVSGIQTFAVPKGWMVRG